MREDLVKRLDNYINMGFYQPPEYNKDEIIDSLLRQLEQRDRFAKDLMEAIGRLPKLALMATEFADDSGSFDHWTKAWAIKTFDTETDGI